MYLCVLSVESNSATSSGGRCLYNSRVKVRVFFILLSLYSFSKDTTTTTTTTRKKSTLFNKEEKNTDAPFSIQEKRWNIIFTVGCFFSYSNNIMACFMARKRGTSDCSPVYEPFTQMRGTCGHTHTPVSHHLLQRAALCLYEQVQMNSTSVM